MITYALLFNRRSSAPWPRRSTSARLACASAWCNLIDDDLNRDVEAHSLAFSAYRKEAHSAIVYGLLTVTSLAAALSSTTPTSWPSSR